MTENTATAANRLADVSPSEPMRPMLGTPRHRPVRTNASSDGGHITREQMLVAQRFGHWTRAGDYGHVLNTGGGED